MLEQNRPYVWGEPIKQWICEHCGIESNSLDHNGNFAHVYRQALHDGGPLLDLCLPCRASLSARAGAAQMEMTL